MLSFGTALSSVLHPLLELFYHRNVCPELPQCLGKDGPSCWTHCEGLHFSFVRDSACTACEVPLLDPTRRSEKAHRGCWRTGEGFVHFVCWCVHATPLSGCFFEAVSSGWSLEEVYERKRCSWFQDVCGWSEAVVGEKLDPVSCKVSLDAMVGLV